MASEVDDLLEQIKAYRNDMVARNYPFQQISDIIMKWENKKDFLEEAEKEKKELNESYQESVRQATERKNRHDTPKEKKRTGQSRLGWC